MCLSGTHLVPGQLHHVPLWLAGSLPRTNLPDVFLPHYKYRLANPCPSAASISLPLCFCDPHTPSCPSPPDLKSQRLRRCLRFCLTPKRKLYLASVSLPPDLPRGGAALDGDAGAHTTATITSAHQDQKNRSDGLFFACCMSGRYCASEVARGNAERPRRGPKITPQRQHCRGSVAAVVTMAPSTQPPGGLFLDLRNTQPANMQLAGWNGTECAPTNQPDSSHPPGV